MARSPFAGMKDAEVGGFPQEPFLRPINIVRDLSRPLKQQIVSSDPMSYALRIDACEFFEARNEGSFFKPKFTVVSAINATPGDGSNAVGSSAVWMCKAGTDGFKRDVKTFCCTAMNFDPALFGEGESEMVVSRAQPLTAARRYILVTVSNTKTKRDANDFTKHTWKPLEASFDPAGNLIGLVPPAVDVVAEYIRTKGELK